MSKWTLHTPVGVNDILPHESGVKRNIQNILEYVFESRGYSRVETPSFEFYDVFSSNDKGLIDQETMIKFFDEHGRILTLRPDITTSIARMAATKCSKETLPLRFFYTGNVFRNELTEGVRQREFTQTGIELLGINSDVADAEVIYAAIEAILSAGLDQVQVEIGQVAFFNGIVEQLSLSQEQAEQLRGYIDSKDSPAIEKFVKTLNISKSMGELLTELPYMFGGPDVLERADIEGLNQTSKNALEKIKNVYDILTAYSVKEYISIDLGMLPSIDYYTGIIFKGYTHGLGFPVFAGGRYDSLTGRFGADMPAVGVAIGINRVMSALLKNGKIAEQEPLVQTVLFIEDDAFAQASAIQNVLFKQGLNVETYINGGSLEDCKAYVKTKGIKGIIAVDKNDNIKIIDTDAGTTQETTIEKLMGEG